MEPTHVATACAPLSLNQAAPRIAPAALGTWPYCVVFNRSEIFVMYFISTECTSFTGNSFWLATKGRLGGAAAELWTGVAWLLAFAVWRILPIPVVAYAWYHLHFADESCGFSPAEWWTSCLSIPVPLLLNSFWFYKMLAKAAKTLRGGKKQT